MELILGIITVILLFLVIAGKYFVTMRLQQLRQRVIEAEVAARTARGKLKQIETQSGRLAEKSKPSNASGNLSNGR